ncbi:MAG: hypothetical protein SGCHY_004535 [Lobulomycetales sp.]
MAASRVFLFQTSRKPRALMTRATQAFHKKRFEEPTEWKNFAAAAPAAKARHRFTAAPRKEQEAEQVVYASKAEKERARRRLRKKKLKLATTTCFACRKTGHLTADCPENPADASAAEKICYKCGAADHTSSRCKKPTPDGLDFPFALCFICNQKGHLSAMCPENTHGIYPDASLSGQAGCKWCGSMMHLARNCGKDAKGRDKGLVNAAHVVAELGTGATADEDDFTASLSNTAAATVQKPVKQIQKAQKKKAAGKVVKF